MTERVSFHFDPGCPWAWQASKWIREVANQTAIEIDWRLFSLALINDSGADPLADEHAKSTVALRSLVLARRVAGNDGVGRAYAAMGSLTFETFERDDRLSPEVAKAALEEAGFGPSIVDQALNDASTMDDVRAEHLSAVEQVGCFGVPTIMLESGKGIFGPVVAHAPEGRDAVHLWNRVRWLIERDEFFELKRERDRKPG
ncbi:MAG: DsbA family protein [Actinomycetota bacterium]|nr:DsbA family protein [Actinomycetota bacterium]